MLYDSQGLAQGARLLKAVYYLHNPGSANGDETDQGKPEIKPCPSTRVTRNLGFKWQR